MADLAARIVAACASSSPIELVPYDQAYERGFEDMARRVPDTSKLERLTGWRPQHALEEILEEMINEAAQEFVAPSPAPLDAGPGSERVRRV